MVPMRIRSVASAAAVRITQGSPIGMPGPMAALMWSHTKNPSHPDASACRARSAVNRASA